MIGAPPSSANIMTSTVLGSIWIRTILNDFCAGWYQMNQSAMGLFFHDTPHTYSFS